MNKKFIDVKIPNDMIHNFFDCKINYFYPRRVLEYLLREVLSQGRRHMLQIITTKVRHKPKATP